jgi:hypothetical protein
MNQWICGRAGCGTQAHGTGGALGLRAIGWYFEPGNPPFCPAHWPGHKQGCGKLPSVEGTAPDPDCSQCAAEKQANQWQEVMEGTARTRHPVHDSGYEVLHTWESTSDTMRGVARVSLQLVKTPGSDFQLYLLTDHSNGRWHLIPPDSLLPTFAALAESSDWLRFIMGPYYRQMRRELLRVTAGEPATEGRTPYQGGRAQPFESARSDPPPDDV